MKGVAGASFGARRSGGRRDKRMAGHTGAFLVCLTAVLGLCDALRVRTEAAAGVGTFWWFTDMHVDVWGSLDEKEICGGRPLRNYTFHATRKL